MSQVLMLLGKLYEVLAGYPTGYLFFAGCLLVSFYLFFSRRVIGALLMLVVSGLWVVFHNPVVLWVGSIGTDSLSEAQGFAWSEAWFFIKSLAGVFMSSVSIRFASAYLLIGTSLFMTVLVVYYLAGYFSASLKPMVWIKRTGVALLFLPVAYLLVTTLAQLKTNGEIYGQLDSNFTNATPELKFSRRDLSVVVYVGESTSALNMGIYGYPRNTTPKLSALVNGDGGMLVFNHVVSTHTHTSASLLEALSFSTGVQQDIEPIYDRKRQSVVKAMVENGVNTYLLSNQGQVGTWNYATKIIFKASTNAFSTKFKGSGNLEHYMDKPFDDVYFEQNLKDEMLHNGGKGNVVFLHSYAGHGDYLKFVPAEFHQPIDARFATRNNEDIFGDGPDSRSSVEAYDSAVSYIDYSVAKIIGRVEQLEQPAVFIYFSDHGDAAYTGSGHDSSRFSAEMIQVPFILYFNDAAKTAYPDLFAKYKALAGQGAISTLAQVAPTLLDLLGSDKYSASVVGSDIQHEPILVRETRKGTEYVDLNKAQADDKLFAGDDATRIFVATHSRKDKALDSCYHRSNTLAKMLRGSMVADCLETDLVVREDGVLAIGHPPFDDAGNMLSDVISLADRKSLAVWVDSKNINTPEHCSVLLNFLKQHGPFKNKVFVEFPTQTEFTNAALSACAQDIRKTVSGGVSYYVSTTLLMACTDSLKNNGSVAASESCKTIEKQIGAAADSAMFDHFSFDYRAVTAMRQIPGADRLKWNVWGVDASEFAALDSNRFEMVILNVQDPNNR